MRKERFQRKVQDMGRRKWEGLLQRNERTRRYAREKE